MATAQYMATVKDSRLLELPIEAEELGLKPGDKVSVQVDQNGTEQTAPVVPNAKGLAAMQAIAERQKNRPATEGSDVVKLVRLARTGARDNDDATE